MECCVARRPGEVYLLWSERVDERRSHIAVPCAGGRVEWRPPARVSLHRVGASVKQQRCNGCLAFAGRKVERRLAVPRVRLVDPCTHLIDEPLCDRIVPLHGKPMKHAHPAAVLALDVEPTRRVLLVAHEQLVDRQLVALVNRLPKPRHVLRVDRLCWRGGLPLLTHPMEPNDRRRGGRGEGGREAGMEGGWEAGEGKGPLPAVVVGFSDGEGGEGQREELFLY
eukprot:scaffold159619_cov30-Tisochrysis_lutea.AAC.1